MKALIIDNSTMFHEMLSEIFSGSAFTPVMVQTAKQALQQVRNEQFSFICVSKYLEDSDGVTLTQAIRKIEHYQNTPIILFTAEESDDIYTDALRNGVTEVFHKKDFNQLNSFIQRYTLQFRPLNGMVLYVEDTLTHRELVSHIFKKHGLKVDVYTKAEDAWAAFLERSYDIVVTDIILEGSMTGMALTNHIRRLEDERGDVPIIAVTGFDDVARRIELFNIGVSDYVIKPIIEEELVARVRNLLNVQRLYKESITLRKRAEGADLAKSQFIAKMSHEFRTPLHAILGFTDLVLNTTEESLTESQRTNLQQVEKAGKHLADLISDTLDIAKIEAGIIEYQLESISLKPIVDSLIEQLKPSLEKHAITITLHNFDNDYYVIADEVRLAEVILNLLSNAIKYSDQGSIVQLQVKKLDAGHLRFAVKDSGFGVADEDKQKLFIPFSRVSNQHEIEGTGLGLVIAKQLIEGMGGKINFKSLAGQGSTFWIDLPLAT